MMQVQIVDGVLMHEQEGDAFLLHTGTGRYFGLNRTGVAIWHALEKGTDPVAALGERWPEVPLEDRRRDTEALITHLLEAQLVVSAGHD
jgi:coenzyme PQQ synthesis protein D (PqqD)